jgi:hypothetical protein
VQGQLGVLTLTTKYDFPSTQSPAKGQVLRRYRDHQRQPRPKRRKLSLDNSSRTSTKARPEKEGRQTFLCFDFKTKQNLRERNNWDIALTQPFEDVIDRWHILLAKRSITEANDFSFCCDFKSKQNLGERNI